LLGITSFPRFCLLLREPPDLEVLFARPQGVEQPLRFAAVHRLVLGCPVRAGLRLRLRLGLLFALLLRRVVLPLLRVVLLLSFAWVLRARLVALLWSFALLWLRLRLIALPRRLVGSGLAGRILPPFLLGA